MRLAAAREARSLVCGVTREAARYPDFFGATDVPKVVFSSNHVSTVMFNEVASLPWQRFGVRPDASGGVGLVRSRIGDNNDFIRGLPPLNPRPTSATITVCASGG